jgi:hypothetical protein
MPEIKIKVNGEDHDILSAYADKYIKGIEKSPAFQDFKERIEREVQTRLKNYTTKLQNCQRVLNDDTKRLVVKIVEATFGDMYRKAVAEQRELYEKSVEDATAAYKRSQESIVATLNKMANIPDVETLIHDTYINALHVTMREFIANRSLRELEECVMGKEA